MKPEVFKKGTLIILIFTIAITSLFAQKGKISGSVLDSLNNDPVSFATIALLKANESSALTGSVSDESGVFVIDKVPNGTYRVMVSFLGFETKTIQGINISSASPGVDLGKIRINPNNLNIETVEVTGVQKTSTNKIDRQTFRAVDFETARGGNAIDILSKIPSVSVDPDGEVSVRGATDFMVYLNGKPSQMDASMVLGQISSNNIESIDIITVPGSRYDAQGKGGIINITTKRSQLEGLSISVNSMIGGTPWTNDTDYFSGQKLDNNRYSAGASLIFNKNRLSLYGSFNSQSKNNKGIGIIDALIYQDPALGSTSDYPENYFRLDGTGSRPKWDRNNLLMGGLSYDISKRSKLSATVQHSQRENGRTAHYQYDTYYSALPASASISEFNYLYNPNDISRTGDFTNFSLDYSLKLDKNSGFHSSFLYENSNLDQEIDNKEYSYYINYEQRDYTDALPNFHSFQTDATPLEAYRFELIYDKLFENGNTLNLGVQPQWVILDGIYRYDSIKADGTPGGFDHFNNSIDLRRDVYAGFIDYSGSSNKLSYMLGLRMEYLNQVMHVSSTAYFDEVYDFFGTGRDYDETEFIQNKFDFFPTVHLQYKADDKNILTIAGSRRINRPPAKAMSPFLYRRHQEIFELGDPLLAPEYTLNGELSYQRNFGTNNLILTGFYRGTNNAIYRVNRLSYSYDANPGGVLLRSYTNSGDQTAIGGELGINMALVQKVKVYIGGSLYNFDVKADERLFGEAASSNSTNWSFKGNLNWNIVKSLKLTLDYSITSASVTPQGENYRFSMANMALNFTPEKLSGWNFSARLLDFFGTNQSGGYTTAYAAHIQMFKRGWIYDYEGRILEFGAAYTINMNGKSATKKDIIGRDYF